MVAWGAIAAVAASTLATLYGQYQASKDRKEQQEIINRMREEIDNIKLPNPEDQKVFYEELERQGVYLPELVETVQQSDTELRNIEIDPRLKQAQLDALAQLQDLSESGMDEQDLLDVNRAKRNLIQQSTNAQQDVTQDMARRGINSSGMEMVQRQMAAQAAANQMNDYEQQVQASARRRALEALLQHGNMAGDLRRQEWGEQSEVARAQDFINNFNTGISQDVNNQNTDITNDARKLDLSERQRIADAGVGIRNSQQERNSQVSQQAYQNELDKAAIKNGIASNDISLSRDRAQDNKDMWSGIVQGINTAGSYFAKDDDKDDKDKKKP